MDEEDPTTSFQPEVDDTSEIEDDDNEMEAAMHASDPVESTEMSHWQGHEHAINTTDPINASPSDRDRPVTNGSTSSTRSGMRDVNNDAGIGTTEGVEPKIPAKKDATLREFLGKMDDYAPVIPDAVTNYYLTLAGLPPPPQTPLHLARLLSLATQKFVADIAADAYQYARIRSSHTTSNTAAANAATGVGLGVAGAGGTGPGVVGAKEQVGKGPASLGVQRAGFGGGGQGGGQGRTVLTMEDLGMAVGEYGVNVKRGEFYR